MGWEQALDRQLKQAPHVALEALIAALRSQQSHCPVCGGEFRHHGGTMIPSCGSCTATCYRLMRLKLAALPNGPDRDSLLEEMNTVWWQLTESERNELNEEYLQARLA